MGKYQHDMSEESEKVLLPEGWREFEIINCEEKVSKSGNDMFVFKIADCKTYQEVEIFAIAIKKKRWFLKSILKACNVPASADGIYDWDIPDVLGKIVQGRVEHQKEEWIDRESKTRTTTKSRIVEIKTTEEAPEKKKEKLPY